MECGSRIKGPFPRPFPVLLFDMRLPSQYHMALRTDLSNRIRICAFLRAVHGWSIRPGGSLLTQGPLCAQTYSATARHEHGAKRNANGTALTNPDSYLRFNMLPLNYTINRKSAHRHYGDGRCSILALKTSFFRNPATHGIYYL